jgi:myo-inositol 2-dehydrogenase/D-chiro-inositol 1-dehydrogenase
MPIRYGIIGTGMMGCEHIRNLVKADDVDVVAVADPEEGSRHWAKAACGNTFSPDFYADYADLLARDDVDAVLIASPNFTHIDVMREVFKTDKHVMLEKPMCTTIEDAQEIIAGAESHQGLIWVALEYRYMAPIAATLSHLDAIGRIRMCAIREHRFPFLKKVGDWNRFNENTGGTLVEKCCHFFDLMNLIVPSAPVRVYASGGQDVSHLDEIYDGRVPDIIDNAYVVVDYAGGERAMLDLCMFAEGVRHEQQLVVTGDTGRIETTVPGDKLVISQRESNSHSILPVQQDPRVREEGFHHGASYLEHLNFIDAIRHGREPAVTVTDGLNSILLGVAGQKSIETGTPVEIADLLKENL